MDPYQGSHSAYDDGGFSGHFRDEIARAVHKMREHLAIERRANAKRFWSMRSMLRKYFKNVHKKVSNAYINALVKKYQPKQLMKMLKFPFGEE